MDVPVDHGLLGERLIHLGRLDRDDLAAAVAEQERSGGRLGEILVASGVVTPDDIAAALAGQWQVPPVPEHPVLQPSALPAALAFELGVVPVQTDDGLALAVAERLGEADLERVHRAAGASLPLRLTSEGHLKVLLTRAYREDGLHEATHGLAEALPEVSAQVVFTRSQKVAAGVVVLAVAVAFAVWGISALAVLMIAAITYYGVNSLYKFKLALDSLSEAGNVPVTQEELDALDERTLPRYTILVPLFKEAEVVSLLTASIRRLDYPAGKLEVLLLCEEDDDETIDALLTGGLPGNFHLVRVPAGLPRTKPKACNFGLLLARGELCVIYDAEDRPEPDQLKKAVLAFRKSPTHLACVQGKLNYFNRKQNLLTRWFAAEYAMWFDLVLPGLHYNGHPIPLGGTSNHFRVDVLRELHAWDPFNVTEDADLGIRLWQQGHTTAMIDSVTLEEANSATGNWIRQRSRWIKGYIQTWLVHMRHPVALARSIGLAPFVSLQLTVGGILVTLFNPLFWLLALSVLLLSPDWVARLFPGPVYYVALAQLFVGNFVHVYLFLIGLGRRGYWDGVPAALLAPLYWVLMSIAGWKGFLQLFTKPFYWEKTTHGLTEHPHPDELHGAETSA